MVQAGLQGARRAFGGVVMTDVARAAGVSQKTVSRVINGSAQVRPEVRQRVLAVVDELGYRRNGAAAALAAGRTHVIGIVATDSALFGIAQHVLGIEREARSRGYGTVVVSIGPSARPHTPAAGLSGPAGAAWLAGSSGDAGMPAGAAPLADASSLRHAIDRALALGAEGVVLVDPFARQAGDLTGYGGVPLVGAEHALSPAGQLLARHSCVGGAERDGGRLATEHLLKLGHTRIVHIGGPSSWAAAALRELGWRQSLEQAGLQASPVVRGDWSARSGYQAATRLLARGVDFTALFVANDSMAIGAIKALTEAGLRIPQDVAVIGFDDLPESEYQVVPLCSVRQDFTEIARLSVQQVVAALEDPSAAGSHMLVPAHLVARRSSGGHRREGGPT